MEEEAEKEEKEEVTKRRRSADEEKREEIILFRVCRCGSEFMVFLGGDITYKVTKKVKFLLL